MWDPRTRCYRVKDKRGMDVYRRTRTAAGMTHTHARRPGESRYSDAALQLMVNGHTGSMGFTVAYHRTRSKQPHLCPCCQQEVVKYVLNDRGRLRLASLRRQRDARLQLIAQPKETSA